jgi:ribosomal-protein-alanine N-acetyltransferase
VRRAQSFPALKTERRELRAVNSGDGNLYHELLSISAVTRFGDFPDAPSRAQSDRILNGMSKRFSSGKGCAWIIAGREGSAPVGAIRINRIDRGWRWGEIGHESHPDFWGRGLMTEAVRAVVACAHSQFKLHRVEAWTLPGNGASDRVLAKAGFSQEDTLRQKAWFKGDYHDFRMFGRVAEDPLD